MQIPIEDIIVKKRIRKDMGDIASLSESLKKFGQISPIVINKKNILVAGGRRLEAAKYLGWRTINAVIAETPNSLAQLEMEVEENIQRRDFTMEEIAEASKKIYRLKNPGFFRRIWDAIVRFFRKLFKIEES
ncbi:MAG: ParB/RepB/Spo0J family partition protein [Treponema sp.]|jgi:ParB family chromosome partitioning protein|nr:ParB/RepB/Spo0J family partition protein [Treponema sp.]